MLTKSSSTITDVPANANVALAYLYWSGWVKNYANGIFWDYCGTRTLSPADPNCQWSQTGTDWTVVQGTLGDSSNAYYEKFNGHHNSSGNESDKYLTLTNSVDLSAITGATLSWSQASQSTSPNQFYVDLSSDGGSNLAPPNSGFRCVYFNTYSSRVFSV